MLTIKDSRAVWAVLVGTSASGTLGQFTLVRSSTDLTVFGSATTGTIVNACNVLLRYGVNIAVIRVATGANQSETVTNVANAMTLATTFEQTYGSYPVALIVPSLSDASLTTTVSNAANTMETLGALDFIGTYSTINTARGTTTGFGLNSRNLMLCFPQVLNGSTVESLAAHMVGRLAIAVKNDRYGYPVIGTLRNGTGVNVTLTSTESDTLNAFGVVTAQVSGGVVVAKGFLSTLSPADSTVNAYLTRTNIQAIITRTVRSFLNSRLGTLTQQQFQLYELEVNDLLSQFTAANIIRDGRAKINIGASTITDTTSNLVFDITISLKRATTAISTITFTIA